MKKETKMLLGAAVVIGVGLYLYNNSKKAKSGEESSSFLGKRTARRAAEPGYKACGSFISVSDLESSGQTPSEWKHSVCYGTASTSNA